MGSKLLNVVLKFFNPLTVINSAQIKTETSMLHQKYLVRAQKKGTNPLKFNINKEIKRPWLIQCFNENLIFKPKNVENVTKIKILTKE